MSSFAVIVTSRLKSKEHSGVFLKLSSDTEAWMYRQPGFLKYSLFGDGGRNWTDIMEWADSASAEAGNTAFADTDIARAFSEIVEPDFKAFAGQRFALGEKV